MNRNTIGHISANIAGDPRYTSLIEVTLDGDKVTVQRLESGAVGGMDGPGGRTGYSVKHTATCAVDPKAVVALIKRAMDSTIKDYGKPTKNFEWAGSKDRGLSVAKCQTALNYTLKRS